MCIHIIVINVQQIKIEHSSLKKYTGAILNAWNNTMIPALFAT